MKSSTPKTTAPSAGVHPVPDPRGPSGGQPRCHRPRQPAAVFPSLILWLTALVNCLGHAASAETTPPDWSIGWELNRGHDVEELSRVYDTDEDGFIDSFSDAAQRLPEILNPQQSTLHVSACSAPSGFTSIDWELARPNEAPQPAVTSTGCQTDIPLPDKPYPDAREYELTATVRYPGGATSTRTKHVRVRNIFMVALGDSYASGEGNPIEQSKFNAKWDNKRCHRSRLSGQEQAARMLDQVPGITVTFLHLACSGALVSTGILEPYEGLEAREPMLPPQITQAAEYVNLSRGSTGAKRYPDLVVTSIGGNDAHFADVVVGCLSQPRWGVKPIPLSPYLVPWRRDSCYEPGQPGVTLFEEGLGALPDLYTRLDEAVDGRSPALPALCDPAHPCDFLITEYPDGSTNEHGDACKFYAPGFTRDEFEWVINSMVPRLNDTIRTAATDHGWLYVDRVRSNFYEHGICADDDYLRDIAESFQLQGGKHGAFHPDGAGHLFGYAPAIAEAARDRLGFPYQLSPEIPGLNLYRNGPAACDDTVGDGDDEALVTAPAANPAGLVLADDIAYDLATGQLPAGVASANSCRSRGNVRVPLGEVPEEMSAGLPGCPDDPRLCIGSDTASSFLHIPKWSDEVPVIDVSAHADAALKAGQDGSDFYRRTSDAIARGTVPFLAVPAEGSATVSGEIVVDVTGRAQASGAAGYGHAVFKLEIETVLPNTDCAEIECMPSVRTDIARVDLDLVRYTCREDSEFEHGCRTTYGYPNYRSDKTDLRAWAGDPETLIADVHEERENTDASVSGDGSVRAGLPSPRRQIRLPYTIPAGAVVLVKTRAEAYGSTYELCDDDLNNLPCAGQARSVAHIAMDPDGTTGVLVPLSGFQAPPSDTTPPVVTATPSGPLGANGWYLGNVAVGLNASDDSSGVTGLRYTVDGRGPTVVDGASATVQVSGDGSHTVRSWAIDGAGNEGTPIATAVKIDATAPVIAVAPVDGVRVIVGDTVPTYPRCEDPTSGVVICDGPAALDTATAGTKTATFTATDGAGNTSTRTLAYTVAAPSADHLKLQIPELGFGLDGDVVSGGFTITRDAGGQPTGVNGTAGLAGPAGGTTTVTFYLVRLMGYWVGGLSVSDPNRGLNASAFSMSRTGVTAVGADGLTGTFTSSQPRQTLIWTVMDRI